MVFLELRNMLSGENPEQALFYLIFIIIAFWLFILIFRTLMTRLILKKKIDLFKIRGKGEGLLILLLVLIIVNIILQKIILNHELYLKIVRSIIIFILTILIVEISIFCLDIWGKFMTRKKGEQFDEEIVPLTHTSIKIVLFLIAALIVLHYWGINIWTLVASLGLASVVLGFALKDVLTNIIGGVSLIFDRTFKIGEVIQLESGEIGEVKLINLRSTRILTYDEKIVSIPNGVLANSKVINYSQPTKLLRVMLEIGVAYGTDLEKLNKVLIAALTQVKHVEKTPSPDVKLLKMNDYAIEFHVEFFTMFQSINELQQLKDRVMRVIYEELNKNKIQIPYPTRININIPLDKKTAAKEKKKGFLKNKV